ncbi:MAG: aspartate aminotransferase family protein [Acidimicrobiia bacterium]
MTDVAPARTDLDAAVAEAREAYAARRPGSLAAHRDAAEVMPGGNTRTVLFHSPFPLRIARGEGSRLIDVDGLEYVDLLGEYTAGLFGHSDPVIRAAIDEALDAGVNLGAHNTYEARLARVVVERFPSIEKVRFTNSGTEANLMALAAARVATGRPRVMVFEGGYHGGVLTFGSEPASVNAPYPTVIGRYNDADGAAATIASSDDLAAVLVEPMMGSGGCIPAAAEFLAALRAATAKRDVLLVFDEVMTSRVAPGGAQELLGVLPDLTTLGKYVGGGMSFGAFGGTAALMDQFDPTLPGALGHAGTFNNNVLTMAAGAAALSRVFTPDAARALTATGDRLRGTLNQRFDDLGVDWQCTGLGSIMNLHPTRVTVGHPGDLAAVDDRRRELLFLDLLEEGYYIARRGFIALSLALSEEQLDGFVDAVSRVVSRRG